VATKAPAGIENLFSQHFVQIIRLKLQKVKGFNIGDITAIKSHQIIPSINPILPHPQKKTPANWQEFSL